jgi:hypothetical protein
MDHPIRSAVPGDAERLAALKLETFRETFLDGFAIPYPADDLALFETASYSPAAVAAELADPEKANWVVEADGRMIAYAQVGHASCPIRASRRATANSTSFTSAARRRDWASAGGCSRPRSTISPQPGRGRSGLASGRAISRPRRSTARSASPGSATINSRSDAGRTRNISSVARAGSKGLRPSGGSSRRDRSAPRSAARSPSRDRRSTTDRPA